MLLTLCSWLYITVLCFIPGLCFHLIWEKRVGFSFSSPETALLSGLCLCAVYAQIYSLFSGLGANAQILFLGICIGLFLLFRKPLYEKWTAWKNAFVLSPLFLFRLLLSIAAILIFAQLSSQTPTHYDTYLYHAQAIHWIEEYGCVPGLGNLHNRFAYNSSFLVLQAFFSLKFLCGYSLHTLNGFVAALFSCYSLYSLRLWKDKSLCVSDALRIGLIYYLLHNSTYLSSPNTDTFALSVVFYIFIKWCDLLEDQEKRIQPYAWLCLLGIFGCTLKLSCAFVLILLLFPLYHLLKGHAWKELLFCVVCTLILVLPFLIRNVILSGYLLYPYSALDLFFVDWKMDAGILDYDRLEIMVWGRGTYDVSTYEWPITRWLPIWFSELDSVGKREVLAASIAIVGIPVTDIFLFIKKDYGRLLLFTASFVCLLSWLFTAPLIRYGEVYLIIICACFFIYWLGKARPLLSNGRVLSALFLLIFSFRGLMMVHAAFPQGFSLKYQDYATYAVTENDLEGYTIYTPAEGTQTGYDPFPTILYEDTLHEITLRGDSLREGFRTLE